MKNGQAPGEVSKEHIHPPGAAYCPICGEEKHSMKLQMNANGVFHTAKTLMTTNGNGNNGNVVGGGGGVDGQEAVMATHGNGNVSREVSMVSLMCLWFETLFNSLIFCRRSPPQSRWTSLGQPPIENGSPTSS